MNRFVQSVSRSTMINRISSARVTALCAMNVFFLFQRHCKDFNFF